MMNRMHHGAQCVGCAGVLAASAVDEEAGSHGHVLGAIGDAQLHFVHAVEGRSLTWADLPRLSCCSQVLTG